MGRRKKKNQSNNSSFGESLVKRRNGGSLKQNKNIRRIQLREANVAEDQVIKSLEKALKLNKRRKKKKGNPENVKTKTNVHRMFVDDGLDYILGAIDMKTEFGESSGKDDCKLKSKRGADKVGSQKRKHIEKMDEVSPKKRNIDDSDEDDSDLNSNASISSDEKEGEISDAVEEGEEENDSSVQIESTNKSDTKYVPPAKRFEASDKRKPLEKFRPLLKGLINRLSESNMQSISSQIEDLYMKNSRNDMNELLYSTITDLIISSSMTPQRLVMEQALLVALLHANTGLEVGAFILHKLVVGLDGLLKNGGNYGEGKICDNLLCFIAELYNYKVCSCTLMFDIMKLLTDSFQDKDIELILLLLQSVGFLLRKDNPTKMKELLQLLQTKAPTVRQEKDSRIQFMLDTITAVRNNNFSKISSFSNTLRDHLKKVLRSYLHPGCSIQELFSSYDDVLRGDVTNQFQVKHTVTDKDQGLGTKPAVEETKASDKILQLASDLRMNTGTRKAIFCIIMGAEDFMDAFEKLLRLDPKNQIGQEIMNVIIHCTLHEKTFNLYYAFLAGKLTKFSRKYQMNLQYSLWDKFKLLDQLKPHQIKNLGSFIVQLILKDSFPLSALKVVPFAEMDKRIMVFLRHIFKALLLHDSEEELADIFRKVAVNKSLSLFKEGVRLFVAHFLLQDDSKYEQTVHKLLENRVKLVEKWLRSSTMHL